MNNVSKERRKFKRFDAYMSVKIRADQVGNFGGVSLSNDLSREGMKIATDRSVDKGTMVDLEINIPDDPKPVYTTGEVMWVMNNSKVQDKDFELGVKFLMMDPVDKFRVLDYAYNNWLETKVNDFQDPEQIPDI
ncbi:MAG: PilZ domain-containing protein [Candidatus Omnitrophica bacterium]|nr:PilZ domain-containing protein [Candidatus Omnitrophota bacterium]